MDKTEQLNKAGYPVRNASYWRKQCIELEEELAKVKEYCHHLEDELDESEGAVWDLMADNEESRVSQLESVLQTIMLDEEVHGIRLYRYIGEKKVSNAYYLAHKALKKGY